MASFLQIVGATDVLNTATAAVTMGAVSVGDLVVVGTSKFGATATTVTGVTDNLGNTYTQVPSAKASNATRTMMIDMWSSVITTGGTPTITVTFSVTNSQTKIVQAMEFSGNLSSSIVDATALITGDVADTSPTGAAVTNTNGDDIIVEFGWKNASNITAIASGGFTFGLSQENMFSAWRIVAANGTYTPVWNGTGTDGVAVTATAFKAQAAGPPSPLVNQPAANELRPFPYAKGRR